MSRPLGDGVASMAMPVHVGTLLSAKARRGLTHAKKLGAPEVWIERIATGWHELGDEPAVLLVQRPPTPTRDDARLDDVRARMPPWIRVGCELRHLSWNHDDVSDLSQDHGAGYCVTRGAQPACILRSTAPHVDLRLYGPTTTSGRPAPPHRRT